MLGGVAVEAALRVALGQALSFLMSLTGVSTTMLVNDDASYPLLQSATTYAAIAVVYAPLYAYVRYRYRGARARFSDFAFMHRGWKYIVQGIVDLEANYCVVLAYQYTDILSVQLFNCLTVPCVLVLSVVLLRARFALTHVAGALLALGGLVLLIVLDADGLSRSSPSRKPVLGDVLCILSSALYATSNVLMEWFIRPRAAKPQSDDDDDEAAATVVVTTTTTQGNERTTDEATAEAARHDHVAATMSKRTLAHEPTSSSSPAAAAAARDNDGDDDAAMASPPRRVPAYVPVVENLACMSLTAGLLATVQFFAIEWRDFAPRRQAWTRSDTLFQVVFSLTMLCVYTLLPIMFLRTSAAFANVSLLTANVYAIIWNVTIFHVYPTVLFFVAYIIIALGIVLYDVSDVVYIPWCAHVNYRFGMPSALAAQLAARAAPTHAGDDNDEQQERTTSAPHRHAE